MARTKISEYSATPGDNTDIDGINIAEGCAPSGINNAIREMMSQLKDFQAGTLSDPFNGPHNGTVGATTPNTGAFTTLSSTGNTTLGNDAGDVVTVNGATTFVNSNPILNAGTANGVAYLNGSKVLTSGTALTFDGTNLGIGTSSPDSKVHAYNTASNTWFRAQSGGDNSVGLYMTNSQRSWLWGVSGGGVGAMYLYDLTGSKEVLNISASGNLGLGVTPSAWAASGSLQFAKNNIAGSNGTAYTCNAFYGSGAWTYIASGYASYIAQTNGVHSWHTAPSGNAGNAISFTQAMTLDSSGNLLVGTTGQMNSEKFGVLQSTAAYTVTFKNSNASPNGLYINYSGSAPNGAANEFAYFSDTAALRLSVRSNGGIANYSANNVNLSDARLKRDFTPAQPWLEKICKIEVGTFFYKDQTEDVPNLGVLAQQVEAVAPELVDTSGFGNAPEGEEPYKAIYQTDMQYAMLKAIQEQQAIINQLKARLDAANL